MNPSDYTTWRVLAVDDEPDNLHLIATLLELVGATVASTEDAEQGLALVDTFRPNLILLDLAMPELDGWELHKKLRARPELDHVPIVALTALAMPDDAKRVAEEGFNGYITKPFRVEALLAELVARVQAFANHRPEKGSNNLKPEQEAND